MTSIPLISASDFALLYPTLSSESVIDVREANEYELIHLHRCTLAPLSQGIKNIPKTDPLYILCRSGARSAKVTEELIARGYNAYNIDGGIRRLAHGMDKNEFVMIESDLTHQYLQ